MAAQPPLMSLADHKTGIFKQFNTEPFYNSIDPTVGGTVPLAAAATFQGAIAITSEADFVGEKWTFEVVPLGALFTVRVEDASSNRTLMNQPLISNNFLGTAQRPALWKPRLFRRNSNIMFTIQNISGAPIVRLQVVLCGYKIFDPRALDLNLPQGPY